MTPVDTPTRPGCTPENAVALVQMEDAAIRAGLTPVVDEDTRSVDLRVTDGDRIVAAIRMRLVDVLGDTRWVYEFPARPGGAELAHGMVFRAPFGSARMPVTPEHLTDLDYWWQRVCPDHTTAA